MLNPLPLLPSSDPITGLPESAIVGPASEYLKSLEPVTRHRVGVAVLRLLASLRAQHMSNPSLLTAFALIEVGITQTMGAVTLPSAPVQVYGPPPTLTPTE